MNSPPSEHAFMAPVYAQRLDTALQHAQREPVRNHYIDSRQSTPTIYPEHAPDEFEYWKDMLETVSRSLETLDREKCVDDYRARILSGHYWQEESNYWKALSKEVMQEDVAVSESSWWEKHYIQIDSRYWEEVRSLDWKEMYRALETGGGSGIMENWEGDLESRRTAISDIIYFRIAAKYWQNMCQPFKSSETYRTRIRSRRYWQAEFDGMSEALRKLRASRRGERKQITQKGRQTRKCDSLTTGSRVDVKTASSPRRSKRIENRRKSSTPRGIKRRKAGI